MKRVFLIVVLSLVFLTKPLCVSAQNSNVLSLLLSPLPINLVANPGTSVTTDIKIKNTGKNTEELKIGLMKFSAYGELGKPRVADRESGDDYFDWITFSENEFSIAANEWKTIKVTINVPEHAAFGYFYAVTFSRKNNEIVKDGKTTQIIGNLASLILLEVRSPNAIKKIDVLEFSLDKKVYEFLPVKFKVKLKNDGNTHVAPVGNIFIDSMSKRDVAVLEVNETRGNVLPNTNRIYESEWSSGFPFYAPKINGETVEMNKNGSVKKSLKWDFNKVTNFRFGKYTANMLLAYDDGNRDIPIEAKVSFWIIPWRLIVFSIFILFILVKGFKSTIKDWSSKIKGNSKNK